MNVKPAGAAPFKAKPMDALSMSVAETEPVTTAAPSDAPAEEFAATGASSTAVTVTVAVAMEVAPAASVTM